MSTGEILLIMVIALLVLGPEKLPKLAADIGRWLGRARAMARQLRTQLDQEVQVEQLLREQTRAAGSPSPPAGGAAPGSPSGAPAAGGPSDEPHAHAAPADARPDAQH